MIREDLRKSYIRLPRHRGNRVGNERETVHERHIRVRGPVVDVKEWSMSRLTTSAGWLADDRVMRHALRGAIDYPEVRPIGVMLENPVRL